MRTRLQAFTRLALGAAVVVALGSLARADSVVSFHDLSLAPNSYWNGPDTSGTHTVGWDDPIDQNYWVDSWKGSFKSGGLSFANTYTNWYDGPGGNFIYNSSGPFAYSNQTDTTTSGFGNQFSSYAGGGKDGVGDIFGVSFGYASTVNQSTVASLPAFSLAGQTVLGMYVTNTTYAALSMLEGDSFAKKFGLGDWFKLSIYGLDAAGNLLTDHVDKLLADYTSSNKNDWYVLNTWSWVDLSALASAKSLVFNLTSSDTGDWGMNTPGYFAFDNLTLRGPATVVPEPASLALAGIGLGFVGIAALRRRRRSA